MVLKIVRGRPEQASGWWRMWLLGQTLQAMSYEAF
jgi:hypothetical protein